ncbi:DUF475 domain-containing protein [Novosphingobium cyanobacteriorum]|uniref:DUF475 domain-containing protein n=1 Tax=Novosphingobium cyanobacteriorum TaxID=3024215 RepID=A0ABT6CJG8_9SPHN|nr:DUF475 domain-containing protein [Novosphingobium cyanobacteriorum]MDF8334063.1 DUF475 domain-containing protein [Novosphingobium cyanobacteriorum]
MAGTRALLQNFKGSILFTLVCLAAAVAYGWLQTGSASATAGLVWIVIVLSVLEISLSFDNAVVNAAVLDEMDEVWQKRFLTWGMLIAVFGMRIVFPLAIVAIAAGIGPVDALHLSLTEPKRYEEIVSGAHIGIAGFGGAFLAMVGLSFFFDGEKDVHWITVIEEKLALISNIKAAEIALLLLALWGVSLLLPQHEALVFMVAGTLGIVSFIAVEAIGTVLEMREEAQKAAGMVVRSGLGGFLYLNVLDASFSFDGVIGAFALSNNMVVIALGLSIGAMFVRSLTLLLVKQGTLAEYRYLEHGAFWAIVALGGIMLASARWEIPETITGLIGAALIGLSLWWSVRHKRKYPDAEIEAAVRAD